MENQALKTNSTLVKMFIFLVVAIFAIVMFSGYNAMFEDMKFRIDNKSCFLDDKTEDLVVELFTKQDIKHESNTKETKRIIFSTSKHSSEKERDKVVNYILNYIANIGGKVNDISIEKVSDGGLIIFRSVDKIIKNIDIEVPKDAPFAENLEDTLLKFINTEKYTMERYNKRHNK